MIQKPESGFSKMLLLAAFSIAFLILYLLLSWNNRLATDDYYYLKNADQFGTWNGMLASYHSWVTRWSAILFLNCVFRTYYFLKSLFPFHLVTILALIVVVMNFIHVVAKQFPGIKITFTTRLLYSFLFTSSFFFFTFSIGESWFWIASSTMYLWSVILFIAGSAFIVQPGNLLWKKIVVAFCFLFIGGAGESIAINVLILLVFGITWSFYRNKLSVKNLLKDARIRMMIIALAALATALLISYFGEGRALRQSALTETGFIKTMIVSVKSFIKLILFYLPLKIHWFIFFSVPWIYLGHQYSSGKKETLEKVFGQLIRFVLLFLLLSFISFIPVSFLLGETGPFRTWILISCYLAICCIVCGFYLGYKVEWNIKLLNSVFHVSLVTLIVLMIVNTMNQGSITSAYANAVDNRIKKLEELKDGSMSGIVVLDALPPSGMLYSAEISEDSAHFSNLHLKRYFDLKFDIKKK